MSAQAQLAATYLSRSERMLQYLQRASSTYLIKTERPDVSGGSADRQRASATKKRVNQHPIDQRNDAYPETTLFSGSSWIPGESTQVFSPLLQLY